MLLTFESLCNNLKNEENIEKEIKKKNCKKRNSFEIEDLFHLTYYFNSISSYLRHDVSIYFYKKCTASRVSGYNHVPCFDSFSEI